MAVAGELIRLVAHQIAKQIARGNARRVVGCALCGTAVLAWVIFAFVRNLDGQVVWGWVLAGAIGGAIVGALFGSISWSEIPRHLREARLAEEQRQLDELRRKHEQRRTQAEKRQA